MHRAENLYGRASELERCDAALAAGAVPVLVVGDAGIGKSRLVAEIARRHHERGRRCLVGSCLPTSTPLPLLPVVEILRGLASAEDGRLLQAVLASCAPYVRTELARLLPELEVGTSPVDPGSRSDDQAWSRGRLFSAIREVLLAAAQHTSLLLVVEDLHWADQSTLDLLTYLQCPPGLASVRVALTCRSDESLPDSVRTWLLGLRRSAATEIRLLGLDRDAVARLAAELLPDTWRPRDTDVLHQRSGGSPFFLEQLIAHVAESGTTDHIGALPRGLAELLADRIRAVSADARTVLTVLAAVGRPTDAETIQAVSGLGAGRVRAALRGLREAKLLADVSGESGDAARHVLLAEAALLDLTPGERRELHARIAEEVEASAVGFAAEAASQWRLAGRPLEELKATAGMAEAAAAVFAFAEAAAFGRRAIELCDAHPDVAELLKIDVLALHLATIEALTASGEVDEAIPLAELALQRFADADDTEAEAKLYLVVAGFRSLSEEDSGRPLLDRALKIYQRLPPTAGLARALSSSARYAYDRGDLVASEARLQEALSVAEDVGATDQAIHIHTRLASARLLDGAVDEGFAEFGRARVLVDELVRDGADLHPALRLAVQQSDACLKNGRLRDAERIAREGLTWAKRCGREQSALAQILASNACEALLEQGELEQGRDVIVPLTALAPTGLNWICHSARAEADLNSGDVAAARERLDRIYEVAYADGSNGREFAQDFADAALWGSSPDQAFSVIVSATQRCVGADDEVHCGELFAQGARAAADLAESARARRAESALGIALAGLEQLEHIVSEMAGRPFQDHPFVVRIPGDRAQWDAERARARGSYDPRQWRVCADVWEGLGRPPRAAYAWWRCAEAALMSGASRSDATDALRRAAAAATGMIPVLREVESLAARTRVSLDPPSSQAAGAIAEPPAEVVTAGDPYGLTARELSVLRLVAAGRTNAQIGAELFMSPKTASVHVTHILRKLAVDNRTQAAAVAARAGLVTTAPR